MSTKKKNELVTTNTNQINGGSLAESCVKFDAKINTSDLVDAVVFQSEEYLLQEKKSLEDLQTELNKKKTDTNNKFHKLIKEIEKKYVNKEVDAFIKVLNNFTGEKYKVIYDCSLTTQYKFNVTASICTNGRNDYYSRNFHKKFSNVTCPNELVNLRKEVNKLSKDYEKSVQDLTKVSLEIKEIPQLKKRVKTALVKNKMKNVADGKQILASLEQAVLNAASGK